MAQRDRSQGFGFVYVDIAKLLTQRDELEKNHGPIPTGDAKTVNFNKDPQIAMPDPTPAPVGDSVRSASRPSIRSDRTWTDYRASTTSSTRCSRT